MTGNHRSRRHFAALGFGLLVLALVACAGGDPDTASYPNTTFEHRTEFNTAIDFVWNRMLVLGTIVFILVEALLVYTIVKFRKREGAPAPKQVHGNTALEITWTVIPAVILVFIAIPTVKTVFQTQAKARPDAVQVEVIGHQWWWEFRYPQYNVVTANELYLPLGRTVNFALKTKDVLHSFWIPRLGGKRDLISNRTNYLWFTPDEKFGDAALNGQCAEYCGDSHGNMKFRVFTVSQADFESWAKHQAGTAVFGAPAPAAPAADTAKPAAGAPKGVALATAAAAPAAPAPAEFAAWNKPLPAFFVPKTPTPAGLAVTPGLVGDPQRGMQLYSTGTCIGCHAIRGNPSSIGNIGPDLTHVGSRHTIAAGLYPNDDQHLALWIKNARKMKPGSIMPTLGKGEFDPILKSTASAGALDDQQIADIVAYLRSLK